MVIEVSQSQAILTTGTLAKLLKSKEALSVVNNKPWPRVINTDDPPKKKLLRAYNPPTPELLAYVDFSVSTTGVLTGVKVRCKDLVLGPHSQKRASCNKSVTSCNRLTDLINKPIPGCVRMAFHKLVDDKFVSSCQQTCCMLIVKTCYPQACYKL